MNLSKKGISSDVIKLNASSKATTLNPNAAEFIPHALRTPTGSTSSVNVSARADGISGKAILDRSESSVSNNSDDEAHQFWRRQLPDDITPDFKFMADDESQGPGSLLFSGLSISEGNERSRFSSTTGNNHLLSRRPELTSRGSDVNSLIEKIEYSGLSYGEDPSSTGFVSFPGNPWDKQFINRDQHLSNEQDGLPYSVNPGSGLDAVSENAILDDAELNPVEFLASQFPGFAAESLAEVYYANGCDLNLTMEMLTQLELQVDAGFNQNLNMKTVSAPNLSGLDFPALSESDNQNGISKLAVEDLKQIEIPYRSADKSSLLLFKSDTSAPSRGSIDFASAVRKLAPQDSSPWKYERAGSENTSVGSSKNANILGSSYGSGHGRSTSSERLHNYGSSRGAPAWLETGEAVGNMYSELREEARDHARLRNAYLEQARQAYLVGNKALAKELSVKGQLHNMQMKAAHGKAQESIYRQRNPVAPELQAFRRGQECMIDLHGLHVNEAIHRLRNELSALRAAARSADQRVQVYICVGTGHHTKGSRTPARLPVAVEQYLIQEGLDFSEPQPGLLRLVIY
ncbi:hypothetical protein Scep_024989 [Stephania cephalantha]|uniref:Smr domain-containing protein n=1 Tax=Stephania cephalantha TaxID=152367 RepID=A0AAP0F6J4_9MAGN